MTESVIDPAELGIARAPREALKGGPPVENAEVALKVLGGAPGPCRDFVLLNAAAALVAADLAQSLAEGLAAARESIDSGRALNCLSRLRTLSNQLAAPGP